MSLKPVVSDESNPDLFCHDKYPAKRRCRRGANDETKLKRVCVYTSMPDDAVAQRAAFMSWSVPKSSALSSPKDAKP